MNDVLKLFFPELLTTSTYRSRSSASFPVNIYEDGDAYHLEAFFPVFTKESISVKAENGVLNISAKKPSKEQKNYILNEMDSYEEYDRSFKMTESINPEKISAKFEGGVLTVSIAKAVSKKPKQIAIA